jgi:16S rRNA (cytosine967-C5)-methyltransferase
LRPESGSSDPRREAVTALARVEGRGAHAARLLTRASPAERELVLGVLRWQLTLDHLLARHLKQPLSELDEQVRAVLRVGLYEAQRMRTPVPVAVAEAVRVAKDVAPRAAGLVNAVLRRAVGEPWPAAGDGRLPLSVRHSHPEWLLRRWVALLGEAMAEAALTADQETAPLCLLEAVSSCGGLAASGCDLSPHPAVPGVVVVAGAVEAAVAALQAGRAYAMDPTAVAVARLLPEVDGLTVDLAAAPGGKSLVLAGERDARLLATDRSLGRALLMRRNLRLVKRPPDLVVADGAAAPLRARSCAAVLLDAPCSGTGTLRRHPEIRWRLKPADLVMLAADQRLLAARAAELVADGGYLLYATCSLEPEENAGVLAGLGLGSVPVCRRLPPGLPSKELPSGGAVIPPSAAGDGFTVHLLRRS